MAKDKVELDYTPTPATPAAGAFMNTPGYNAGQTPVGTVQYATNPNTGYVEGGSQPVTAAQAAASAAAGATPAPTPEPNPAPNPAPTTPATPATPVNPPDTTGTPGTPFTPPTPANITVPTTQAQDRQDLIDTYGAQVALIDSVPELSNLLNTALSENWSATKWQAEYENTNWYQQHGAAYISSETDRLADPGKYAEAYNNLLQQMIITGQNEGINVSSFGGPITADQAKAMDPSKPNAVATMLQNYYNVAPDATVLSQYVAKNGQLALANPNTPEGAIATTAQTLRTNAANMGVASQYLTPSWTNANGANVSQGSDYFTNAALAVQQGLTTVDSENALYRSQAQAIYKPFAQQIANGASVAQLAQPYTSAAANLLEVDPSTINLGATTGTGSLVTKALQGDGTNAMSLDSFTTQVKQQPAWLNTMNAKSSVMDTANTLLRNFGLVTGS